MLKHILFLIVLIVPLPVFSQQALPNEPVTLQRLNLMLRREVGRNMTEAELAVYIQRVGIDFDPTPEAVARLRANGAHQHLINTIRREAQKLVDAGGKIIVTGPQAKDPFIEEVRSVVREYLDELPDFICNQVVERYYDFESRGAWDRADTLTYELTYNRKRESYKPVNVIGRPVTRPLDQAGGAYSTGDFASGLATLFDPETGAVFKPAGKERLGKRPTVLYDFTVPQESSKLSVKADGFPPIIAGYSGAVWIDAETKHVLRIDQAVDALPASFPVTNSESSVDYDTVTLRGLDVDFLLPIRAEFIISDRRKGQYFRNLIYFKFYRKFETDIKISDEEPPPVKPPQVKN
ncbi:MAG: hypothetical protein IPM66_19170 [Acidobacteriota bacterium]|nr:MAG: hypothetical protein IPM66_19170 [Acidobacteriota bacterium]